MSQLKSVLKNSAIYTILGFLPMAANFVMVPLLTSHLTTEEYGLLSVSNIFQGVIAVFMLIGLDAALARFYFRYYKKRKLLHANYSTGILFILGLSAIIFVLLYFFGDNLLGLLFKNDRFHFHDYGIATFFLAISTILYTIMLAYYRNEENIKMYATLSIMSLFALVGGILIGVVYLEKAAYGNIMGRACAMSLMILVYLIIYFKGKPFIFRLKSLKPMLQYGLPFVPYFFLLLASSSLDQWIIERKLQLNILGEYNFAFQLASLCSVFTYAIYNAIGPRVYKLMSEDESGYKNEEAIANLLRLFHLIVILIVVGEIAIIAPVLELIIANKEYHNSLYFINLLILSWLPHMYYMLYSIPLMFFNKTKFLPVITFIGLSVGVLINLLVTPIWGIIGVCFATIVIKITVFAASYWIGTKQGILHLPYYRLGRNHLMAVVVFLSVLLSYFLGLYLNRFWLYIVNLIPFAVFTLCSLLLFKRELKMALGMFRRKK